MRRSQVFHKTATATADRRAATINSINKSKQQ
jgi:hypothetical protein